MSEERYKLLKKIGWILFFTLLILNIIDLSLKINSELVIKTIPFELDNGRPQDIKDETLKDVLKNKIITKLDTVEIKTELIEHIDESGEDIDESDEQETEQSRSDLKINLFKMGSSKGVQFDFEGPLKFSKKDSIEITYKDTLTNVAGSSFIKIVPTLDKLALLKLLPTLILLIFTFFNSYLLLRYSSVKENILIVYFLIFLMSPSPDLILGKHLLYFWGILLSPFWGILFYHFVVLKVAVQKNLKKLYLISSIIFGIAFVGSLFLKDDLDLVHIWSAFWMFKGFLLLRKEYKKTHSIELKRLWGAFSGIGISLISIIVIFVSVMIIGLIAGASSLTGLSGLIKSYSNILAVIAGVIILIPVLGIFLGFFWFLGSFSWSLLTGTALDVKIRSTMIYTIVGVFFVIVFGLVDYSLGELLQNIFGKFVGSEFIAGIPVTIGLIAFFNPVRNKVEKIVDSKLNTSELDFLEKTETFTHNLSEEGVLEGFEEYICENLIHRLPISKVALISYDNEIKNYKFNEIRGSDIIENSKVDDVHLYLLENKIHKNYGALNEDPQDISSFALIIPIIYDLDHKWFLSLGKKNDKSLYSKRDEQALIQLAERIKLSLKFILAYEEIVDKKYHQTIEEYERNSQEKDRIIEELKKALDGFSEG